MTKKITLVFVLFLFVFGLRAESLLNEGFEGWSTTNFPTGGWTVINDTQEGAINHWTVDNSKSACAGSVSLYCNGGEWDPIEPVKEEWIVSPSLTLSETNYNLSFLWKGASASAFKNEYDFQVRITEDDGKSWKTVFSFLDQSMYNPQIQISEKSQTKRIEIADSRKTKRPKIDKRTTPNKRHSNAIITL